jgi:Peptidase family M48
MNVTQGGYNFRGPSRPPTRSACRITILRHYLWQTISWMLIFPCLALGHSPENVTSAESLPQEVLHSLLSTPLGKTLPALPYSINQVQTYAPNAFSSPNGQMSVTLGTYLVLGKQRGLWAGLLGHELGHALLHNPQCLVAFEREMQQAYLQARPQIQDGTRAQSKSQPAASGAGMAWLLDELNRHGRHEQEYEADIIGLMLMAEAGYHPQFFLALGRDFNFYLGSAKVTSFFAAHPNWGNRQKRLMEVYDTALNIFQSRWPDVAQSPGGKLPALGSIGKVAVAFNPAEKALIFRVPMRLENPDSKPIRIAITLLDNNKRVPSALAEYRSADGFLVVNSDLPSSARFADEVTIRLPVAAVATQDRRLRAAIYLATGDEPIAESRLTLDVPER